MSDSRELFHLRVILVIKTQIMIYTVTIVSWKYWMFWEGGFFIHTKNYFFLFQFISNGLAWILEGTIKLKSWNNDKHDLLLITIYKPPLLSEISSLIGKIKSSNGNWFIENNTSISVLTTVSISKFLWISPWNYGTYSLQKRFSSKEI